jgi:hypothetical protein
VYPAGRLGTRRVKIREADGSRWVAPGPRLHRQCGWVIAGFQPEGGNLVLPVADVQGEVVQGVVKDGIGAFVAQAMSSDIFGGSWWAAALLCLVEGCSAALSV